MSVRKRKRRIIRTFDFGRILAFVTAVCIAVACAAALLGVKRGEKKVILESRALYGVVTGTYDSSAQAAAAADECAARGGAGYITEADGRYAVMACMYSVESDAVSVASRIDGATVCKVVLSGAELIKNTDSEKMCKAFEFFSFTVTDNLMRVAAELEKREISESEAAVRIDGLKEEVLAAGESGDFAKTLADSVYGVLNAPADGKKPLLSHIRFALCSSVVLIKDTMTLCFTVPVKKLSNSAFKYLLNLEKYAIIIR